MTANDLSDQSHRCPPVYMKFNSSVPLALPADGISRAQTIVQYQARIAFQDRPHQSEKRGQGDAGASSLSFRRPASTRRVPKGPYSCDICRKVYAQPQGVSRHHREAHSSKTCTYCGDFEWGRPYRFKEHLKRRHPNIDPDVAVDEARRIHRRAATTIRRYLPQQRALTPTHEYGRGGRRAERPLTLDPSAVVAPSTMSFASYKLQSKSTESTMQRDEHEDATELRFFDVTDSSAHTTAFSSLVSSTEVHAQRAKDPDVSVQIEQTLLADF